ncbi:hypothetical protein PIB30_049352 [Stylosanthes scabra]|uniref:Uncharacterized protein n=1 Tax=Stylosanthes scabra TaxID=79078 RepID=A0ABU6RHB8_9FABA|nr:hypothetical protein [Stylosanthes scabra]
MAQGRADASADMSFFSFTTPDSDPSSSEMVLLLQRYYSGQPLSLPKSMGDVVNGAISRLCLCRLLATAYADCLFVPTETIGCTAALSSVFEGKLQIRVKMGGVLYLHLALLPMETTD